MQDFKASEPGTRRYLAEPCTRRYLAEPCTRRYLAELQRNILRTFAYADIFYYPLTAREVANYLISDTEVTDEVVQKTLLIFADPSTSLRTSCQLIYTDGKLYFLKGRGEIVKIRKERAEWAKDKWEIARRTVEKLKIIPTIKMVGVTGALAMENCKKDDDIDLIIITSQNCLWLTRLLILLVSFLMGIKRRKPADISVKDKICFNLFLDENHLKVEPETLFLAHEVCQVKPVYDKGGIYEKFMRENRWVREYLPNAVAINNVTMKQSNNRHFIASLLHGFIAVFDRICFYLQYQYMKPKMTTERVNLHQAFFHPKDLGDKIQREFERKIKSLDKEAKVLI